MKSIKIIVIISFIGLFWSGANAQAAKNNNIVLLAKNTSDTVYLRWSISDPDLWWKSIKGKWMLERVEFGPDTNLLKSTVIWDEKSIYIRTLDKLKDQFKPNDSLAGAMAQVHYGKILENLDLGDNMNESEKIARQMQFRHLFALQIADMRFDIANAFAMGFADVAAPKNKQFFYRINLYDAKGDLLAYQSVFLNRKQVFKPQKIENIRVEAGDKKAYLIWSRSEQVKGFTGFYVDRSDDDGKTWKRLNKRPFNSNIPPKNSPQENDSSKKALNSLLEKNHVFPDTFSQNYKKYTYRVSAQTPFGEPSAFSEFIYLSGRDLTPPPSPNISVANVLKNNFVELKWSIDSIPADLAGYFVSDAASANGPFHPVHLKSISPTTQSFIDSFAGSKINHYYIIIAYDTCGNVSYSTPQYVQIKDNTPPVAPSNVRAIIDSSGLVLLSWDRINDETMRAYKVFMANQKDHTFIQIAGDAIQDTFCFVGVTLNTLTEKVFFKVIAVDNANNYSPYSEIIEVKRPDILPPMAVTFLKSSVNNSIVSLIWSESGSPDIDKYRIFRSPLNIEKWELLRELKANYGGNDWSFMDTILSGGDWKYMVISVDDDGLVSTPSFMPTVYVPKTIIKHRSPVLTIAQNTNTNEFILNWTGDQTNLSHWILYKDEGNSIYSMWRSVSASENTLTIFEKLSKGTSIKIQAAYNDNSSSDQSNAVTYDK